MAAATERFHLKNEDVIFSGSGTPFVQFSKLHGFSLGSLGEAFDGTMAQEQINVRRPWPMAVNWASILLQRWRRRFY
jgi:hypothetical protein